MNFTDFIEKAKSNLCKEYTEKLNRAGSKKAMLDLALDSNGLSWTAEAVAKGELDVDSIVNDFKPFLNGRYVREKDGYTSAMYCRPPEDKIEINTTAALIIGFKGTIKVDRPCEIYLCKSDVTILGQGKPKFYLYNSTIINDLFVEVVERKWY